MSLLLIEDHQGSSRILVLVHASANYDRKSTLVWRLCFELRLFHVYLEPVVYESSRGVAVWAPKEARRQLLAPVLPSTRLYSTTWAYIFRTLFLFTYHVTTVSKIKCARRRWYESLPAGGAEILSSVGISKGARGGALSRWVLFIKRWLFREQSCCRLCSSSVLFSAFLALSRARRHLHKADVVPNFPITRCILNNIRLDFRRKKKKKKSIFCRVSTLSSKTRRSDTKRADSVTSKHLSRWVSFSETFLTFIGPSSETALHYTMQYITWMDCNNLLVISSPFINNITKWFLVERSEDPREDSGEDPRWFGNWVPPSNEVTELLLDVRLLRCRYMSKDRFSFTLIWITFSLFDGNPLLDIV